MYMHSDQGMGPEKGLQGHTWGPQMFVHNYAKEVEQIWGVRWTCTDILMHLHILTKVWNQKRGDWDTQVGTQRGTYLFAYNNAQRLK